MCMCVRFGGKAGCFDFFPSGNPDWEYINSEGSPKCPLALNTAELLKVSPMPIFCAYY